MMVPLLISGPEVWSVIFDLSYREVDFDLEFVYWVTGFDLGYQEVDFDLEFVYWVTDLVDLNWLR